MAGLAQSHPGLQDSEDREPTLLELMAKEEDTKPTPDPAAPQPEATPQTPTEPPSPTTAEEDNFIKLDKRQLTAEIARLERTDKDFANHLNTYIGRKAATKYQPQIESIQQQLQASRQELRRREIFAMTPEEIEEKYAADPVFAREYTETVHSQPQEPQPVDETPQIRAAWAELVDYGQGYGLTQETISSLSEKAAKGEFDIDGQGWRAAMQVAQKAMTEEILKVQSKASTPPAAPEIPPMPTPPATNPALAAAGPDISPPSHAVNAGSKKWTKAQLDRMTPPEFLKAFPGPSDYDKAIKAGQVDGVDPNDI